MRRTVLKLPEEHEPLLCLKGLGVATGQVLLGAPVDFPPELD